MVIGTFFKTGFEKGLPLHEQVVRHLLPLVPKARKGFWPYYFAVNERVVLPRRAGAALNSRLRIPGKNRHPDLSCSFFFLSPLNTYDPLPGNPNPLSREGR